ncbi:hypothetical protein [Flavobacterium sp.]|uniref:hypothetical protein n=1 Tax=Flavobacterium sp. TaxID=239 RepID=UPI00286D8A89|nr:hypothetical protein [Flavobacterium sp.]
MKKSIFKSVLVLTAFLLFSSCSNSSDNPVVPIPIIPVAGNSWKMNDYNFSRRISTQTLTNYTSGKPFTQVNVDSNISTTNNNFKTCNVVFWFNTHLAGVYSVKSKNTVASDVELNYMNIQCVVYDLAGKGAIYESSIDSNVSVTVEEVNGKLVITCADLITLTKTLDDGLANAPETMTFTCDKVL